MNKYKFSELSKKAQEQACKDYYKDAPEWLKEQYTWNECEEFCKDTENDIFYDVNGNSLNEN